jgi:hypothetical protein
LIPTRNRHPERSASQIYRVTRTYSAESKDPEDARWPMLFRAFRPPNLKVTTSAAVEGPLFLSVHPI